MIKKSSWGFSLLEILLAIFLSGLLVEALLQTYLIAKKNSELQIELADLTDNLRLADYFLRKHITDAGHAGCRTFSELEIKNNTGENFDLTKDIYGYEIGKIPEYLRKKVADKSDVIVINKMEPTGVKSDFSMDANCSEGKVYESKCSTNCFTETAFFISDTGRKDNRGNHIFALYYSINRNFKRELVANIDSMKVYYGIAKRKNSYLKYYRAEQVKKNDLWRRVVSLKIELTMQTQLRVPAKRVIYIKLRGKG